LNRQNCGEQHQRPQPELEAAAGCGLRGHGGIIAKPETIPAF
jgi:hypothetical protein